MKEIRQLNLEEMDQVNGGISNLLFTLFKNSFDLADSIRNQSKLKAKTNGAKRRIRNTTFRTRRTAPVLRPLNPKPTAAENIG